MLLAQGLPGQMQLPKVLVMREEIYMTWLTSIGLGLIYLMGTFCAGALTTNLVPIGFAYGARQPIRETRQDRARNPTDTESISGQWQFSIKWEKGGTITPRVDIVKDQNLERVKLEPKEREKLKTDFADRQFFVATAEWENKGARQSDTWIVLVKDSNIRIAAKLFACEGTLKKQEEMEGRCLVDIVNQSGSFKATRPPDAKQK
jgi:hypothetical protein